ncbi:hypothetical protein ALC57_09353 [Trachymyrmex cornetzi]|uniref:CCHC-type domain-containing protein n=1 Tax=Trachymyrmex cornetzi TaxID=471704 RepID=A0A151J5E1_9HYME|nr:hypothetical protein ALC57_09353 [Trachymyrmex cornetzi]
MLPPEVALFSVLYKVDAFVPRIKICYTCYRAGHIGKDCKSTQPRCLFCGSPREDNHSCSVDQSRASCINCGREHLATSHTCSLIIKHKTIINLAAKENIPLIEAKRIVSSQLPSSPTSQNTLYDFENFPYLTPSPSFSNPNTHKLASQSNTTSSPRSFQNLHPEDNENRNLNLNHRNRYAYVASHTKSAQVNSTLTIPKTDKPTICSNETFKGTYKIIRPTASERTSRNTSNIGR